MSQHKTGLSNWTAEERQLYWDRRKKGLRGQTGAVTVHRAIKDENGNEQLVPLGNKIGSRFAGMERFGSAWQTVRGPQQAFVKQQRRATSRGE